MHEFDKINVQIET